MLLGGEKIAGSAERQKRGAVLQHGSVLLQKSAAAPELMGLVDLTGRDLSDHDLASAWRQALTKRRKIAGKPKSSCALKSSVPRSWSMKSMARRPGTCAANWVMPVGKNQSFEG